MGTAHLEIRSPPRRGSALPKRSVTIFSEALGRWRHHSRTALLMNEHSASTEAMLRAFAQSGVATIVGLQDSGRPVATSGIRVGHGHRVALQAAACQTWIWTKLEGKGVAPDVERARLAALTFSSHTTDSSR